MHTKCVETKRKVPEIHFSQKTVIQTKTFENKMDTSMWETLNLGTGENTTKAVVRQKVWEYMEKNDIANFPRPVYHRIPNFKGAQIAGKLN